MNPAHAHNFKEGLEQGLMEGTGKKALKSNQDFLSLSALSLLLSRLLLLLFHFTDFFCFSLQGQADFPSSCCPNSSSGANIPASWEIIPSWSTFGYSLFWITRREKARAQTGPAKPVRPWMMWPFLWLQLCIMSPSDSFINPFTLWSSQKMASFLSPHFAVASPFGKNNAVLDMDRVGFFSVTFLLRHHCLQKACLEHSTLIGNSLPTHSICSLS